MRVKLGIGAPQGNPALTAVMAELRPDLIGLQEVWARGGQNLAGWLASHLGMHWTWAPSRAPQRWQRRLGDSTVDIGNVVLSRWPITEHDTVELPARPDDDDGRLALYARIDGPTHQVPFFTTHLTSAMDASAVRCRQVDVLADTDPARPSATWDTANPYVAAGFEPGVRVDYIHVGLPGPDGLGSVSAVRPVGTDRSAVSGRSTTLPSSRT
ncbi:MAG TPA: endonuclease/exonuclease/phosphatase family protein [Pseudonocardiaceae bacterium]